MLYQLSYAHHVFRAYRRGAATISPMRGEAVGNSRPRRARLEGFEPPASGLEVRCSIQLSYRRILKLLVGARGFEPPTPCSQSRCATGLRHAPGSILPNRALFNLYEARMSIATSLGGQMSRLSP